MTAQEYVEAIAREVGRLRGGGLLLSPADAQLALSWHAAGLPLPQVLEAVRGGRAMLSRGGGRARGALELPLSLQAVRGRVEAQLAASAKARRALREAAGPRTLGMELSEAARAPGLPAREAWASLAARAEALLAQGPEGYWAAAAEALLASLRALPRARRVEAGRVVRERRGRRTPRISPARYRRALQQHLLRAASELFQVPPKAFLL